MNKKSQIQVTEAEWEVMLALWLWQSKHQNAESAPGATAGEIIELVQDAKPDWNHRTIRTLVSRLVDKGAIQSTKIGSRHEYRARVSREECVQVAAQSFFDRFFEGSAKSMLLHMMEHTDLSEADIEELRQSLNEKKRDGKKQNRKRS